MNVKIDVVLLNVSWSCATTTTDDVYQTIANKLLKTLKRFTR